MSAIATYRIAVSALLYDPSNVIFTTAEIDQALLWALLEYSYKRPLVRTYDYSVIGKTTIHTLPADFTARQIIKVELWDSDPEKIYELVAFCSVIDEQWVVDTLAERKTGDVLQISYSAVHQIDGLDSAAGTTIPLADETLLEIGAAGHAAQMRSVGTIESVNMNDGVNRDYLHIALDYLARFVVLLIPEPGAAIVLPDFPKMSF
jgi:hypothetical protein